MSDECEKVPLSIPNECVFVKLYFYDKHRKLIKVSNMEFEEIEEEKT